VAYNQHGFESADSTLLDVTLPETGTYYVGIDSFDQKTTGNYQLFMYSFATLPGSAGGDTLVAGIGNDTLVGSSGNDQFVGVKPTDVIVAGSGTPTIEYSTRTPPTLSVSDAGGTYSGSAFPATVLVNGAGSLEGVTPSLTYYDGHGMALNAAPANAGTYSVVAAFAGSQNYGGTTSQPVSFTIIKASSTTITVGDGPFTYDGTIHTGGSGTVSGAGGLNTVASSLTYSGDQVDGGAYYVTAHYAGDANHDPSDGAAVAITINQASSTTSLLAPDVTYNNNGTVTVTVSSSVVVPVGMVQLSVDGSTPLSQVLSGGSATFTLTSPNAGDHGLSATFATQGNFLGSSASGMLHVNPAATAVTIKTSTVTYNADGSANITVTSSAGVPGGTVTLSVDGSTPQSQPLLSGAAVFTIPGPGAGPHALHAAYAAQGNFAASSADATLNVNQAPTTVTITAPTVTYNANGIVTLMVGTSGAPAPTGYVTLSVDGGAAQSATLNAGTATFTLTSPSTGDHTLHAVYAVQGNYAGSSADGVLHVNSAATSVTISAPTVTYNSNGIVTVSVTASAGVPAPSGSVTLTVNGGSPLSTTLAADGTATFTLTSPNAGTYMLHAVYATQGNYFGSSADGTLKVCKATSTTITVGDGPFTYDGTTHTGGSGIVTGAGGLSTGATSLTYSGDQIDAGTYYVTAHYAGDVNHNPSDGAPVAITINKASSTTITVGAGPFTYDGTTHTGGSGTVTGAGGLNTVATSLTYTGDQVDAGTYHVTAHYAGDTNHNPSDGAAVAITIDKAASTTSLFAPDVTYDNNGTVTVTVSSSAVVPVGMVQLSVDGGTPLSQVLSGGSATFTLTSPNAGDHSLSASYATQGNFLGSSASGMLHVNPAATAVTIKTSTVTYNADGSANITVTSSAGVPGGTVTLRVDGATPQSQPLSNGAAVFTMPGPGAGPHALHATYAAQGNFAASSADATLNVNQAPTTVTIAAPMVTYNANGIVTLTVGTSGAPTPAGYVTLSVDGGVAQSATLSGGTATFTLTSPSTGDHTLHAAYAVQGNYDGSSADAVLHVNPAATSITIAAPDVTYNSNGVVTVTVNAPAGVPAPGGSVTLTINGGSPQSATLAANGSATFTLTSPNAGSYMLHAVYVTQGNYFGSTADGLLTVNKASSTTITVGAGPFTYDTTTHTGGSGTVTGVGGLNTVATSLTYSGDQVNAGTYYVTAHYAGDANHNPSDGAAVAITINKASSTTITVGAGPFTYDGTIHASGSGTVTGVGGLNTAATSLTYTGDQVDAGTYYVTAHYAGDANHKPSDGSAVAITINKASSTTTTVGAGPFTYSGTTHAGGSGTVTGAGGLNTVATSLTYTGDQIDAGTYYVTAHYAGDTNHSPSDGSPVAITINQEGTTTGVTAVSTGQSVTFTATITPSSPASTKPTGTVDFIDITTTPNTDLGTMAVTNGSASKNVTSLSSGGHTIKAVYSGDGNFVASFGTVSVTVGSSASIFVLNSTASGALSISGNGQINIPGNLVVDSNSATAVIVSGNATVSAASISVVGGVKSSGNTHFTPGPVTGVGVVVDPLASLAAPSVSGSSPPPPINVGGSTSLTINPGLYTHINVSGNGRLTMNPGIYVIAGGGFSVTGNGQVNGSEVLIYNAGSNYPNAGGNFGGIALSGSAQVNLTAPASGAYAGIVFFQARDNTRAISVSGNALIGLGYGMIYAPTALLTTSGDGQFNHTPLVVNQLQITGNGINALATDGISTSAVDVAGQLLGGDLQIYVDNSAGYLTSDELARINDALAAINVTLAPYSVAISQVSDPSLANFVMTMDTTTGAGGLADGVLGAETDGKITFVQGWNWYAGANAAGVGPNQYDFETVVVHEMGHALGLGHSADTSSVMYANLSPGAARRDLTTADLAVPSLEAQGYAHPLLASPYARQHPSGCTCPLCTGAARQATLTPVEQMLSQHLPWGHSSALTSGGHQPGCNCPLCTGAARANNLSIEQPAVDPFSSATFAPLAPADAARPVTALVEKQLSTAYAPILARSAVLDAGVTNLVGPFDNVALAPGDTRADLDVAVPGLASDSDVLVGGSGNDVLIGGQGNNLMIGGFAAERFTADHSGNTPAVRAREETGPEATIAWSVPDHDDAAWAALAQLDGRADNEVAAALVAIDSAVLDQLWSDSDWGWNDEGVEHAS
jgi:hypothetical protein